jgi:hypothetical protein
MSGIYHSWDGTVLTITSDAGTSSADLKGDDGVRGPQGPAGILPVEQLNELLANIPVAQSYDSDEVPGGDFTGFDWVKYLDGRVECNLQQNRKVDNGEEFIITLPFEINNFQEEIEILAGTTEGTVINFVGESQNYRELIYAVENANGNDGCSLKCNIHITGYWR